MRAILAGALVALALTGSALAQSPEDAPLPVAVSLVRGESGGYSFRDDEGRALYFFDRDTVGQSNCNGQCATAWPPVAAPADARTIGDWTPVRRVDGTSQWAYRGKPVYRFASDADASQASGASVPGWRVAAP